MGWKPATSFALVGLVALATHGLLADPADPTPGSVLRAQDGGVAADLRARLRTERPGGRVLGENGLVSLVYGVTLAEGESPTATAASFVDDYAGLFGITPADLAPESLLPDGRHTQPVMFDPLHGQYRFTMVYYTQRLAGLPVFRADLRLLVRNDPGYPLVWASSGLRPNLALAVKPSAQSAVNVHEAIQRVAPDMANFSDPEDVIWAGIEGMPVEARFAMVVTADNGRKATADFDKRLFVVDAGTGDILYQENRILHVNLTGRVTGLATTGKTADECAAEIEMAMPYARVQAGSQIGFSDAEGNFSIPTSDIGPIAVSSPIQGRWFRVSNQGGSDTTISRTATAPGPVNFQHNAANSSEFQRAEVNGYVQANVVRDFALEFNPDYPDIATDTEFPVNVNCDETCNAYYDFDSINFFRAGNGCRNTAFSGIVHHEFGHHLVQVAGSGQDQYGEGMSDTVAVLIVDDPEPVEGMFDACNSALRTASNNMQYPCFGESHECGNLISGCVWSTRNALVATNPSDYLDILSNITINSILLHRGGSIGRQITIDFLTLDDNDASIFNGTPHRSQILSGFAAHNMVDPDDVALDLLSFTYPAGRPAEVMPGLPTTIRVNVNGVAGTPIPGQAWVIYTVSGASPVTTLLNVLSPNSYEAVLPAVQCGQRINYYFRASAVGGQQATDPHAAPAESFLVLSTPLPPRIAAEYDFESDQGWTVGAPDDTASTGVWNRGAPEGTEAQPSQDHSTAGTQCWVTDYRAGGGGGDFDVDNGKTTLFSPILNLSQAGEARISYWRWFSNDTGSRPNTDTFRVDISNNGGTNWVNVESLGGAFGGEHSGGWFQHSFLVGGFVTLSDRVRLRFVADDNVGNQGSLIEAALDDVRLEIYDCQATGCRKGDLNTDGRVNGSDVRLFTATLLNGAPAGSPAFCATDMNDDGRLDAGQDAPLFVACALGQCR